MQPLRHEADRASAPAIERAAVERGENLPRHDNRARCRTKQSGEQRERRRLAAARRSGEQPAFARSRFPPFDGKRERRAVAPFDVLENEHGARSLALCEWTIQPMSFRAQRGTCCCPKPFRAQRGTCCVKRMKQILRFAHDDKWCCRRSLNTSERGVTRHALSLAEALSPDRMPCAARARRARDTFRR